MTQSLKGRTALVTGAAQGIGLGIARRLGQEGARVILADIKRGAGAAAAADLNSEGLEASFLPVDIGADAAVAACAAEVQARFGALEILVNNAALIDVIALDRLTLEHHQKIQRVNADGVLRMCLAFRPLLQRGQPGARRILNIASIMGMRGSVESVPYSTAKGAVVNMTRALAADLAPDGILVNALAPGFVDTPSSILADGTHEYDSDWFRDIYLKYRRLPLGRFASPEDIAGPAFFLCGDDSRYITGQILMVDGGVSALF